MVTVLLIPLHDPVSPDAPRPDQYFLRAVCDYVEDRRLLTTELHLRGPRYVPGLGLDRDRRDGGARRGPGPRGGEGRRPGLPVAS